MGFINQLITGGAHIAGIDLFEVPIPFFKAYFSGLNFREYHHKIWPHIVQYLHFRILEFPLTMEVVKKDVGVWENGTRWGLVMRSCGFL